MKTFLLKLLSLAFISASMTRCGKNEYTVNTSRLFDSTVSVHLHAIATANLEELEPTVGDSVIMISPFGDRVKSKTQFMDLHRNWFTQTNWEWTPIILETEHTDSLGYTLLRYVYSEKDSAGNTSSNDNYLILIFRNSKEGWKLIHDQNTRIRAL